LPLNIFEGSSDINGNRKRASSAISVYFLALSTHSEMPELEVVRVKGDRENFLSLLTKFAE